MKKKSLCRTSVLLFLLYATGGLAAPTENPDPADEVTGIVPTDRVHGPGHQHDTLEEIVVTATPLARDVVEMSQSATVLQGDSLRRELANSVGETLGRLPGLANASFGENVGRPVIRGLQGARVGVLSNNMNASDASAVSQDHAVAVEPFLADQIEVLRGPATLLYGSGAIGGVVNMVTHSIPQAAPDEPLSGRFMLQGDSAADQRFAAGRLDAGGQQFALHANAFVRRTSDYEIPGQAELHTAEHDDDEHEEEDAGGVLHNSFVDNEGGTLGASWFGESWRFGLSATEYRTDYGIPGGHHAHEEEDDETDHAEDDYEDGHEDEHDEDVTIGLDSSRLDLELVGSNPFAGFEQMKLRVADTGYEHTEFEGDEVGTVFTSDTVDGRLELRHHAWGNWTGAMGGQYTDRDFSAVGEEAFVPPSRTHSAAVFWVESAEFDQWQIDMGVRYDSVRIRAEPAADATSTASRRNFKPFSASFGAVWHVSESSHLTFNVARTERAPTDQELFSLGPHIATRTFEVGDAGLDTESSLHFEAGWRLHQGRLTGSLTVYTDRFDDYIYQQDTGTEEDGFPVRLWAQQDADFIGGELELRYDLGRFTTGHWQLTGFADVVRAELDDGGRLPRLPPKRIGLGLDWDHANWSADLLWIHAFAHTRTAEYETRTPGYDLLNAELAWLLPISERFDWEVYLKGNNLLDEDIRNSTSFLKDEAPQIGRNFIFGLRASF